MISGFGLGLFFLLIFNDTFLDEIIHFFLSVSLVFDTKLRLVNSLLVILSVDNAQIGRCSDQAIIVQTPFLQIGSGRILDPIRLLKSFLTNIVFIRILIVLF